MEENCYGLEEKLEENSEKLNNVRKYSEVLYREYILAYRLNVNDKNAEVLSINQRAHAWKMEGIRKGATFDYDVHMKNFEKSFIVDGNNLFLSMLNRDYIARRMEKTLRFSFKMECIPNVSGNRYYEIKVVRVNPNFFDGEVIIVSEEIDDVVLVEEDHKKALNTERKYLEVLTGDFVAVYHVDLKKNVSFLIKVDSHVEGYDAVKVSLRQRNDYFKKVNLYANYFVVPEQREFFRKNMDPQNIASELEKSHRLVYRYQTIQRKQEKKFFEVQVLPMNEGVNTSDVLIAFRDIDDVVTAQLRRQLELEKRLEREINQNEVLTALGNSFCAIFRIDLDNDTYEQLLLQDEVKHFYNNSKYATEEIEHLYENYIVPEHYEKMKAFSNLTTLKERMKNKDSIEAECMTVDGNWYRTRFIAKRRDENENLSHVLYVTQMISDEKNREERLISMAEAANEANAAKTEFVSKVAHDIRTPMNSLYGFLQLAEANINNPLKVGYSLEKIRVAVDFLKELVNDVLDISKMENNKLTLNNKNLSVKKLFEELPSSMGGSDFGKKLKFNYNIHNIICNSVMGDSLRLKQIYTNILSNAVKYTPDGGKVDFEVYEEASKKDDYVILVVKVSDTGIGMSEDFMEKMFSKFERATDTRLNSVSGYGLGLSIVKQLVDLMGGYIDVESELGKGTTFTVKIELQRVENEKENEKIKRDYKEKCRGMRLLVAEDNELSREVIKELLAMNDIYCDVVFDGSKCIEMFENAKENTYDAILMDFQMPIMNGIDASKKIRSLDINSAKTIPIIAMTANALKTDVDNCLEAGMNKHLAKPIDFNKLIKVLAELKD